MTRSKSELKLGAMSAHTALSLFQFVGLVRASMSRRVMRGVSMVMDGKDVRHRARLGSARGHGLGGSSHDADVLLASL
jgi:hypothetical protein